MRSLVRTEVGLVAAVVVAVMVTYVGLAITVSGDDRVVGVLVLLAGLWLFVGAPVTHDQLHRERGESGHAVWGRGERRKPPWWPTHR